MAIGEEAESLDPPTSMLFTSEIYQQHLFDTLVGIEGDDFKPVGLLAEKWETVNPTTWRFHLRKGVKFHNGKALDAEDVKYSIEQYTDQKNRRSVYARGIERVEVQDANTVDIVTTEPVAAMLFNITRLQILPRDAREKAGAQGFAQQPIGTGPYRFVEWKRDQQLVLEANPAYWRGAVSPKRLVFRAIRDASTRAAELRSGGVDIIATPPVAAARHAGRGRDPGRARQGRADHHLPVRRQPRAFRQQEGPRGGQPRGEQGRHRQERARQTAAWCWPARFTSAWLGYDPSVKPYPVRPRPRQAAPGRGRLSAGPRTTWSISSGVFLKDAEIAEAVAGQLRQVGIRLKLAPTERAKIQKDAQEGTFQGMTSVAWGTQFEPDPMLNWVFMRPHMTMPKIQELVLQGPRRGGPREAAEDVPGALPDGARRGHVALRPRPGRAVGQAARRAVATLQHHGQQGHRVLLPGARCALTGSAPSAGGPRAPRASTCT